MLLLKPDSDKIPLFLVVCNYWEWEERSINFFLFQCRPYPLNLETGSDNRWNFFFQNSGRYSFNPGSICDSLYRTIWDSVSQTILLAELFWLRKITTDPHTLAYVNSYLRNEFRYLLIHASSIRNKLVHELILTDRPSLRGYRVFLLRYSKGHTKGTHCK